VTEKSNPQQSHTISVTDAELVAGTECAQDMLHIRKALMSLGLKVELQMSLHIENKGVVDLTKNWSIGGRMRHIEVRYYFIRELREAAIIQVHWIESQQNSADLFTKNLPGPLYRQHASKLVRE
jgi:hypothetical protein